MILGGGVTVKQADESTHEFVDRQIVDESRAFGTSKIRSAGLMHVESLFHNDGFELGELT